MASLAPQRPRADALAVASLAILLGVPNLAVAAPRDLSDADLIGYAASPFDHAAMMGRRIAVGRHRGVAVVADFPCSDICPQYTRRIVHYDVPPGAACEAAGGVTQNREVPYSIAVVQKPFCIPKPLATAR